LLRWRHHARPSGGLVRRARRAGGRRRHGARWSRNPRRCGL